MSACNYKTIARILKVLVETYRRRAQILDIAFHFLKINLFGFLQSVASAYENVNRGLVEDGRRLKGRNKINDDKREFLDAKRPCLY